MTELTETTVEISQISLQKADTTTLNETLEKKVLRILSEEPNLGYMTLEKLREALMKEETE